VGNGDLRHLTARPLARPITYAELDRRRAELGGDGAVSDDVKLLIVQCGANLGFAGGNNVGLQYLLNSGATGCVWLLNNDTVVAPDSARRLAETLESDATIGGVGAMMYEYDRPDFIDAAGGGRLVRWQGMPRETTATGQRRGTPQAIPRQLDFITFGSMMIPIEVVRRVGLIDERYFLYCEDIDYSLRIKAAGLQIALCDSAEVWHKGGRSVVHRSPRHDYHLVRSSLLLVRKFNPVLVPLAMMYSLARCALPKVVRFQGTRLKAVGRAYRDFFASPKPAVRAD
jgi:GT2 family glycosyltransferase